MHSLNMPEHQMGASDPDRGIPWRIFFPHERIGRSVVAGGRIYVDGGVLNPELLATHAQPEAADEHSSVRSTALFGFPGPPLEAR